MREEKDLEVQLLDEGEQPEACFIHEALSLLRSRKDSLQSDCSIEDLCMQTQEGLDAMSLSSPEEPSSCDSLSSMDEPMSPTTPSMETESFQVGSTRLANSLEAAVERNVDNDQPVVTVEDLDISQLQPVNNTNSGSQVCRLVCHPPNLYLNLQFDIFMHKLCLVQ